MIRCRPNGRRKFIDSERDAMTQLHDSFDVDVLHRFLGKFDTPVCQLFWHVSPLCGLSRRADTYSRTRTHSTSSRVTTRTMRVVQSEIEKKKGKATMNEKGREKETKIWTLSITIVVKKNEREERIETGSKTGRAKTTGETGDSIFWLNGVL